MLPIYISYFAGGEEERTASKTLRNALSFVLGFTIIFVALGAFAGVLGGLLQQYRPILNIITGLIVIFFGLNFLGIFKLNIFRGSAKGFGDKSPGFFSSLLFGMIFSVGWTPCVGAFLGSALMLASQQGTALTGIIMLLLYSMGLGIPFVISALLIDKLKGAFSFIKKHYGVINFLCGSLLIIVGILMMSGLMGKYLALLS